MTTTIKGHCAWCKEHPVAGQEHECDGVRTYRKIPSANLVQFGTMVGMLTKTGVPVREAGAVANGILQGSPPRREIQRAVGTWE